MNDTNGKELRVNCTFVPGDNAKFVKRLLRIRGRMLVYHMTDILQVSTASQTMLTRVQPKSDQQFSVDLVELNFDLFLHPVIPVYTTSVGADELRDRLCKVFPGLDHVSMQITYLSGLTNKFRTQVRVKGSP